MPQPASFRPAVFLSPYVLTFSAELDLILACCGDDSSGDLSARIRQILEQHADLDWGRLLQLAQHHGLLPLVYRRLSGVLGASPSAGLEALRQEDKVNAHRTMWLTLELVNAHNHLAVRGLEVLPYKGPVLAESLYGNVALRQFSDIDLLVRAKDVQPIRLALAELGYKPGLHLSGAAERAYLKSGYEYTFDGTHGKNLIEIKWQILPRFYAIGFEVSDFFERAVTVDVGGQRMRTLCEQDLMLVLCVHAAKHAWARLSWLCEIAQLARSKALDWEALRVEAERLGIARILSVSFLLAHKLLLATPPPQLRVNSDVAAEPLAQRIQRQVVADTEFDPESAAYFRLMMNLRERGRDRASFSWRLLSTPGAGEWSAVRLPAPLFPLYRGVRMFRLVGRMISSISKA